MHNAILITAGAVGLGAAVLIGRSVMRNKRRKRLSAASFSDEWKAIVEKNVPLYKKLPGELKEQLHGLVNVFLAEKKFEGCGGQEITDEVRVTIAAQGCMLLLNRKTRYFRKLKTILVYPHTYVARSQSGGGIDGPSVRLGESWQNGPVVLSWNSVTGGTMNMTDGRNVVIHELAHQLDQEDGAADGAPILESRSCYRTWAEVLGEEYEGLRNKKKRRRRSVLNKYGATNPAEFFSVATEAFFEKSRQMRKKQPELYEELRDYYKVDPASWFDKRS